MALYMLVGETAADIMSDAGITIVIGLVVVFGVLLLLTGIFKLFGVVMSAIDEKGTKAPASVPQETVPAVDLGPVLSEAQVRNGITDEETAVIAAAVAVSMPAGQPYTIQKIDRAE